MLIIQFANTPLLSTASSTTGWRVNQNRGYKSRRRAATAAAAAANHYVRFFSEFSSTGREYFFTILSAGGRKVGVGGVGARRTRGGKREGRREGKQREQQVTVCCTRRTYQSVNTETNT